LLAPPPVEDFKRCWPGVELCGDGATGDGGAGTREVHSQQQSATNGGNYLPVYVCGGNYHNHFSCLCLWWFCSQWRKLLVSWRKEKDDLLEREKRKME